MDAKPSTDDQSKSSTQSNDNTFEKYRKKSRYLLIAGIIIVSITPIILTRPALFSWLTLSDKSSEIGDTIGGITAPFVNLIGAILVYLSFERQVEANQLQRASLEQEINQNRIKSEYDTLESHLKEAKDEFYKLRYKRRFRISKVISPEEEGVYEGEESLEMYADDIKKFGDIIALDTIDFGYALKYFTLLIETFDEQLEKSIISSNEKSYLAKKFLYFYEAKIAFHINSLNKDSEEIEEVREELTHLHDDTSELIAIVQDMYDKYDVDESRFE